MFSASQVVSKQLLNVAVMCTFGLACPLLLVCVAVEAWLVPLLWRLKFRRYLCVRESSAVLLQRGCVHLEASTAAVVVGYSSVLSMVVFITGVFWGLFLFDMVGDVFGAAVGGLMVMGAVLCGMLIYLAHGIVVSYDGRRKVLSDPRTESIVELRSASKGPVLRAELDLNVAF